MTGYITLVLVKSTGRTWDLYFLNGNKLNGDYFRGNEHQARNWATAFLSSWIGFTFITEEEYGKLYGKSFKTPSRN